MVGRGEGVENKMIEKPSKGTEVFRYSRGDEVRVYTLHIVSGGTELWRVTERRGQADSWIKEEDFRSAEVAGRYLEEIERMLTAGGWRHVSEFQL
jgi:hypothetical protein